MYFYQNNMKSQPHRFVYYPYPQYIDEDDEELSESYAQQHKIGKNKKIKKRNTVLLSKINRNSIKSQNKRFQQQPKKGFEQQQELISHISNELQKKLKKQQKNKRRKELKKLKRKIQDEANCIPHHATILKDAQNEQFDSPFLTEDEENTQLFNPYDVQDNTCRNINNKKNQKKFGSKLKNQKSNLTSDMVIITEDKTNYWEQIGIDVHKNDLQYSIIEENSCSP